MLINFCFQWANYFFIAWMPVYLQEGRHLSEAETKPIIFAMFTAGIISHLAGGFISDWIVKRKGLRFGRRFIGMTGLGTCGLLIFLTALIKQNDIAALCLISAGGFVPFSFLACFGACTDVGRNNCGTVTGAVNFFGQTGAFFLALIFGKIAEATHNFNNSLFVLTAVLFTGSLLWLAVDPNKKISMPDENKSNIELIVTSVTEANETHPSNPIIRPV